MNFLWHWGISELEGTLGRKCPLRCLRGSTARVGRSLQPNTFFLFSHESVYYVRALSITGAFAVTLRTGLDQPMRLASEFLQWPVNGWIILHISWPARKWKCPVLMANLPASLESWKYAWSDLWKWAHSFWCLWESKNTNYQTFYHLWWPGSDLDPTAIFNAKIRICLSLRRAFSSSSTSVS